jgi:hypothetical protein
MRFRVEVEIAELKDNEQFEQLIKKIMSYKDPNKAQVARAMLLQHIFASGSVSLGVWYYDEKAKEWKSIGGLDNEGMYRAPGDREKERLK